MIRFERVGYGAGLPYFSPACSTWALARMPFCCQVLELLFSDTGKYPSSSPACFQPFPSMLPGPTMRMAPARRPGAARRA